MSMSSTGYAVQVAAVVGVVSCTVFFAMNTTLNYIAIPAYLLPSRPLRSETQHQRHRGSNSLEASADLILRQWELTYSTGHMIGPASCILSTLAFLFAAWMLPNNVSQTRSWYYFAAVSAAMAFPFTVIWIFPVNDELYKRAARLNHLNEARKPSGQRHIKTGTDVNHGTIEGKTTQNLQGVDTLTLITRCHYLSKIRALMPIPAILAAAYAMTRTL